MKKLIAMLACLTLVLTMFAGLTVSAADKATMKVEFLDYVVSGGNVIARANVYYKVPDTMVPFTSEEDPIMMETYWTGTGVAASQFGLVSSDAGFKYFNAAKSTSPLTTSTALADKSGLLFSAGTTHSNCVATAEGLLGVVMFKVDPASYTNSTELTFKNDAYISVRKVVANSASVNEYRLANNTLDVVTCTIPAYESGSSEYEVTYAAEDKFVWEANSVTETVDGKVKFTVKPAFGYKITAVTGVDAVIAEGGEMEATLTENTEINVTVEEINAAGIYAEVIDVEGTNYVFAKAPVGAAEYGVLLTKDGAPVAAYVDGNYKEDGKFVANAVNGAFGIGFTFNSDIFAGVSATAYADALTSAAMAIN